jgi:uncharacterized RDD family membrane protein YckC
MTNHQLKYCRICSNKGFDPQTGIYCSLTGAKPDFEDYCPAFKPIAEADFKLLDLKVEADKLPPATMGNRFVNSVIDTLVYYFLTIIMGVLLGVFLAVLFPESLSELETEGTPWFYYALAILVHISYFTFCESVFGRTVGKLVTGTKVVDHQGKLPDTGTIFMRSLARLVPFDALSFLGSDSRGWHDAWTNTYVVKVK